MTPIPMAYIPLDQQVLSKDARKLGGHSTRQLTDCLEFETEYQPDLMRSYSCKDQYEDKGLHRRCSTDSLMLCPTPSL